MHSIVRPSLLLLLAISGLNAAELPKKAQLSRYSSLWDNSPFTTKPPPTPTGPVENPFDNWALKGVAPIAGGYLITLINKKNPAEAVPPIDTDRPSEYKVLSIERDPDNALGTVVYLSKGDLKGSVTFDEKLSIPKPPAVKPGHKLPGQPPVPGQPPQLQPQPQPVAPVVDTRQPRARVVPPPATGAQNGGNNGGNNGARTNRIGGGRGGSSTGGTSQRSTGR
ncbi:MAG: hypothetical protein WCK77_24720 [Verrucomicrobiota bacterium]